MKSVALALFALAETLVVFGQPAGAQPRSQQLWIDRVEIEPWLPALNTAAGRTGLPVALLAELIGQESGFQNIGNAHSSAYGFGQQLKGNTIMAREHLDRRQPADSILGAAIQFREALDRTGTVEAAARSYGTTAGLPQRRRQHVLERLLRAARGADSTILLISYPPGKVPVRRG